MKDQRILAAVNLHGIIRNLEDLSTLVPEARELLSGIKKSVKFKVPGIDSLTLYFENGICKAVPNDHKSANIVLVFTGPEHFTQMVEGKKNPIPIKGFTSLSFLKNQFTAMTKVLEKYLRPEAKLLESDKQFRDRSTILTALTAFYSLAEIANHDKLGKLNASRIEDGDIAILIADDFAMTFRIAKGKISIIRGATPKPKASMKFDSIDTAAGILRGTLDSYACIGTGSLSIYGRVPMIDNLNKLLTQVAEYLN